MKGGNCVLKRKQMQIIAHAAADCGRPDLVEQMERLRAAQAARNREYLRDLMFRIEADRLARHAEAEDLKGWLADERAIRQAELQVLREEVEELKVEAQSQVADYAAQRQEGHEVWQRYLVAVKEARTGQIKAV